jgi:hypothetical protein
MISSKGRSLELYYIDGNPDGMLTAEVFNWTGHVLMTPRTQISESLKRKEAHYTGVYMLFGENDLGPLAYIGEGEDISYRIRNHDAVKDWWTSAIFITSAGNTLNKAHVQYLEARLIEEARRIGKITLENGNTPSRPSLSESAQANMEAFLDYILMILPALRIDCLLVNTRPASKVVQSGQEREDIQVPVFELRTPAHGVHGIAKLIDGEFVVQAGSKGRRSWQGTVTHNYRGLFEQLVATNIFVLDGDYRVFNENYAFRSPSAAGAVLNGRATNGPESWRAKETGQTYREWEAEKLLKENEL